MEIKSERELAALLFGVTIAADLDCEHEATNSHTLLLGDFENIQIWVGKDRKIGRDCGQMIHYHAIKGIEVSAENEAKAIWSRWVAEEAKNKKNEKQVKKCKK